MQIIRQSGETLLTIINDILDFSKVEAGKLTVESLPFDLRVAAEQVVELLAPQAERKGIELAMHVSRDRAATAFRAMRAACARCCSISSATPSSSRAAATC